MSFSDNVRTSVLVKCKRHCCLCGNYAGIYINLHHIKQEAHGGLDTEENCIPLCLKCHGEVGHYNEEHPIGLKYKPDELILRRNEVYEAVKNKVVTDYPEEDIIKAKGLLDKYYQFLENVISTDPCGEPVMILLIDYIDNMSLALQSYSYTFISAELDREKINLIEALNQWHTLLCNENYFHMMNENFLCFNSSTVNEYREMITNIRMSVNFSYLTFRTAVTGRIL